MQRYKSIYSREPRILQAASLRETLNFSRFASQQNVFVHTCRELVNPPNTQLSHCTCSSDDVAPNTPCLEHAEEDPKELVNQGFRARALHFGDIRSHLRQISALRRPHGGRG